MPRTGNVPINISLPEPLAKTVREYFSNRGKGALSKRVESELVGFLRRKGIKLPAAYSTK